MPPGEPPELLGSPGPPGIAPGKNPRGRPGRGGSALAACARSNRRNVVVASVAASKEEEAARPCETMQNNAKQCETIRSETSKNNEETCVRKPWKMMPRGVPNGFPEASGGLLVARLIFDRFLAPFWEPKWSRKSSKNESAVEPKTWSEF